MEKEAVYGIKHELFLGIKQQKSRIHPGERYDHPDAENGR